VSCKLRTGSDLGDKYMSKGLIRNPCFLEHESDSHPERPARLECIDRALESSGILDSLLDVPFEEAGREWLRRVHTAEVVDLVFETADSGGGFLDPDTYVSRRSQKTACMAVGAGLAAVDSVFNREVNHVMCLVRPPGHHSTPTRSMGFCLFNNVAIAAEAALERESVEKVAIVDFDVHHGNGTQDAFYSRRDVFFLSLHQWPHYPGTGLATERGSGEGKGTTLNYPLPPGVSTEEWFRCFREGLESISVFGPDLVLVSAGFDSHRDDPLGDFPLTDNDFERIAGDLSDVAGDRGTVSLLEGGYNLKSLGPSVVAYLKGLR